MLKRIFTPAASAMAALLIAVANIGVSPLSVFIFYEPDVPECLKK